MKNYNLIKRLWTDSHEKQSPQRFGRYAAILIMLLTLGVGQMWGYTLYLYTGSFTDWENDGVGFRVWTGNENVNFTSLGNHWWSCTTTRTGTMYIKRYSGSTDHNQFTASSVSSTNNVFYVSGWNNSGGALKYYIKHPWDGGSWTWQTMTFNSENTFKYTGIYKSSNGANVNQDKGDSNYLTPSNASNVNDKVPAIWTYTPSSNSLRIDPAYTLTVTNDGHGSASGSVSKGIKMSTKYAISASSPSTGYHFNNWTKVSGGTCTFDNASSASTNVTVTGDASATVQANFALNTYTVAYNANDAQYPGTATGSTSSSSHTYGTAKALTSNGFSRAGYTFAGWNTEADGSGTSYTNGQSVTNLTSTQGATVTLYAKWTENKSTVTLVASPEGKGTFQVGGETVTSTQAGVTTTPSVTAYPISGYRFTGWSITGGASISSTSDNPTTITGGGAGTAATLTATFEENLVYYDVTFGVGTSYTSLGSLSATNNTTSSAISSGDDILSASNITFTASPETGYEVAGFYSDASCETLLQSGNTTTYTIASLSSAVTVYVKFVEKTWSVAFAAGTGGTVTTPNTTPKTVGQLSGISIAATPSSGYTFNTWTISSGSGSFGTTATTNSNSFYPTAASTITASFNETMRTITISGGHVYGDEATSGSAGVATKLKIQPNAAAAGKKFKQWSLGAGASLAAGYEVTDRVIEVNATANATVTATYVDRTYKKVYFAKPSGWTSGLKVYAWDGKGTPTYKNAAWPGVEVTTTEAVKGTTYHYYKFYTDNNGEGDNQTGATNWTKIIFSKNGDTSTKTADLTLTNGHYYHKADGTGECSRNTATVAGSTSAEDWYVCGYWNESTDDWGFTLPIALNGSTSGSVTKTVTASRTQEFKIYRASTDEWYKWTGGPSESYDANKAVLIGSPMTLRIYNNGRNTFSSVATEYRFTLDITSTSNPVLTVAPATDNDYTATISVHSSGHGTTTPAAGGITLHQYTPTTITATPQAGYRFKQWNVSGCTVTSSTSATTTAFATANGGTIEAEFTQDGFIYFDNTMSQWKGDIYVYLFTADKATRNPWWDSMDGSSNGPGIVLKKTNNTVMYDYYGKMTRIGESNIYYFNYHAAGCSSTIYQVVFTKGDYHTSAGLYQTSAAYRADFKACMPMYIASKTWSETNKTGYHNSGYWKRYNVKNSGLTLRGSWNSWSSEGEIEFTSTEENSNTFKASVTLGNATHQFKIYRPCVNGSGWLGNTGTMQPNNSTGWEMTETDNCHIYIPSTGTYVFTLNLGTDHIYLSVEYPLLQNDYRLLHSGRITTSGSDGHKHPSQSVRHLTGNNKEQRDTVSFFIDKDNKGTLYLQKCTNPAGDGGRGTWADSAAVTVSLSDINKTGVYNFEIVQTTNGSGTRTVTANILDAGHRKYDGNLYIRTDVADGGWDAYEKVNDNVLIFTEYAKSHSNYDHYHCHWTPTGKNLHFTIATDYSPSISDTMKTGAAPFNFETLPYEASVRFMYNSETNVLGRAYLNGSNEGSAEYLKIQAMNDSIRQTVGSPTPTVFPAANHSGDTVFVKFKDLGNWVYQYDLKALEGTHYRLISNYRYSSKDHLQYFKGNRGTWNASTTELLLGGTGGTWQKLRLIYDFKTNNLVAAWMPDGNVGNDLAIHADMMLIRRAQNAATQLTFTSGKKISDVKTMVCAVEFFKDSIVGKVSNFSGDVLGGNRANRELMLYISFPFDVAVNDIYGCGDYNKEWYIQYYDGAERASKGWFKGDGTTTFWKFMDRSDTLRAGVGYSLLLDNDYFNTDNAGVWKNIADGGSVYLFFPSAKELDGSKVIKTGDAALTVPSHECTIDRTFVSENSGRTVNHKFTDSHWNMMGVPLFQNQTSVGTDKFIAAISTEDPQELVPFPANTGYFYEWDPLTNTLSVRTTSGYTFKSMHGYMVQFTGTVGFIGSSIQPAASVVARRAKLNRDNYTLELQLLQNNKRVSRTYVELREEACDTFALNEDVYMVYTSQPADLFTLAGNYDVSANVLTENDHIIPVGVDVHKAGTYTFTMPSNFSGSVTLVDNELNTRTNLALSDYEVTLPKGVCEGRFSVEIGIRKTPTSIDVIEDGGSLKDGKAHKFIMNDQMYIIKNGVIYDARGARVK